MWRGVGVSSRLPGMSLPRFESVVFSADLDADDGGDARRLAVVMGGELGRAGGVLVTGVEVRVVRAGPGVGMVEWRASLSREAARGLRDALGLWLEGPAVLSR